MTADRDGLLGLIAILKVWAWLACTNHQAPHNVLILSNAIYIILDGISNQMWGTTKERLLVAGVFFAWCVVWLCRTCALWFGFLQVYLSTAIRVPYHRVASGNTRMRERRVHPSGDSEQRKFTIPPQFDRLTQLLLRKSNVAPAEVTGMMLYLRMCVKPYKTEDPYSIYIERKLRRPFVSQHLIPPASE